ncbi:Lysophosphatidylcholine acyltransferase [Ceratocystis fimbriata CBS 114723]|uniref:Tafazzin family protein n=1 Tax=Ceratocystis fimbriata CBS 114723 TaxID=1035309 RepID=A0A2C5X2P3_9PEZI|nr:Lysophosphatidylcholine acyltransferase [Ceratocystis fimbriata CBS 114723]
MDFDGGLPDLPTLPWRMASSAVIGAIGLVCKTYLYGLNNVKVTGMEHLLEKLDARRANRSERGLLTISNHVSVVDDPLIWGVLPFKYMISASTMRWSLGAHDICFQSPIASTFFALGQVLPTHRFRYSPHGGIYQPTMTQALHMLSSPSASASFSAIPSSSPKALSAKYSTDGVDIHNSPAFFRSNRNVWLHIFPEGCITQSPMTTMRYFKWGVARFILEAQPTPDVIPMFINGTQDIMPEDREPRWLPKWGVDVNIAFGTPLDVDAVFGDLIAKWRALEQRHRQGKVKGDLQASQEAQNLRLLTVERMWEQVNKVKTEQGYPITPSEQKLASTFAGEIRDNTL